MQTQRDRVAAHTALVGRMSAALLYGRTTYEEPPARRVWFGLVCGLGVGVLVGVGFGVYGLLKPLPSTAWATHGAVVVEKETGMTMVWEGGVLVPVTNYASALLRAGDQAHVETVDRARLIGVERAGPVGIPGAPDSLPTPDDLVQGPVLFCLPRFGSGAPGATGELAVLVSKTDLSEPVAAESYVWVQDEEGAVWVIAADRRMRVDDPSAAALGLLGSTPPTAPRELLETLPEGPSIAAATIEGDGEGVDGSPYPVGRLLVHRPATGGTQHFVQLRDGVARLSATESALMEAAGSSRPAPLDAAALAAARRSSDDGLVSRIPDLLAMAPIAAGDRDLCVSWEPVAGGVASRVTTVPAGAAGSGMVHGDSTGAGEDSAPLPSEVVGASVQPMTGLLVVATPLPVDALDQPEVHLVTDTGLRYRLVDDAAVRALGLAGVAPRPLDADLIAMIPAGPDLGRAAVGVDEGTS